jgi:hypothetical protein
MANHLNQTDYTVAFWEANQATLDAGPNFNINDTAAHIQTAINALNGDSHITQIIISDNTSIVLTVAKLTNDTAALGKLVNADLSPATLTVRDTANHIGNGFATIGTSSQVTSIVVSDNLVVTLSATQVTNNPAAVDELVNADTTAAQVTVKDTAAHLALALDVIEQHLATITSIVVSNSFSMTLTAAQIANDAAALAEVTNNNLNPVTFKVSDTGANIGAHLDALQANSQITTITDSDNAAINLSIAQFTSDATALSKVVNANATSVSFIVTDTAANISSAINSLNGNAHVVKVIVSDSGSNEVTITAAQAAADTAVLSELFKADGTTAAHVAVSDTAANISAAFNALNANIHVDKIVISPTAALTLTAGQVANDTTALGEISGSYSIHVSDTAANVTTNLDALQASGHVTAVVISDNLEITVSVTQLSSDATVIGEITNQNASTVHVIVADVAASIVAQIGALNGNSLVNKIIVTDSATNEVTITAAQVGADTTVIGELFQANGTTPAHVAVLDTAAHIAGAIDALNTNSHVDKIIVSDSGSAEVTITAAQAAADTAALGELFLANGTTPAHVAVSDTAANIAAGFNALNANSHVDKIIVSNSGSAEVTITAAQAAADTAALAELFQSNGTTPAHVAVSDTAANISGAVDALNANTHVDKIIVSDSATNEVTITAAQAAADSAVLGELFQANGTTPAHVAVSDTAANVSAAFDALNSNSHVDKIIVSNSGSAEVTITAAQAAADTAALGELFLANGTTPAHVAVSDTAANISGAFNALNANSHVDKIIVSDSALNEVTITAAQAAADTAALGELFLANGTTGAHVAVSDSAANIAGAIDALNANVYVNKIIVSNSGAAEVTITVAQAAADTTVLNELFLANGTTPAHVAVSDTAANIAAAIGALNANSHVDKIIVSNSGSAEVTITAAQAAADSTVLGELFLANGTTPAHVAVSDTAANIAGAIDALNANSHVDKIIVSDSATNEVTITAAQAAADSAVLGELFQANGTTPAHVAVSDSAANISSAFDALNANTHVDKIVVSNSGSAEVTISASQAASDTTALGELFLSNGTTPAHVAVSDTAANIAGAFTALNANTHVDKIVVSDSATNEVTISVAAAAADTTALGELFLANGTTPAHVAVSDTASAISAAFDALNANAHVNKIIVNNGPIHAPVSLEVTISVAQLASDTTALAELVQTDGVTQAHVAISDTAAHLSAAFDTLNANSQVDHIIISDSNPLTLSASQVANDTTALGEITSVYTISVSDTAANITANLDALQANGHVGAIVVSDNAEITVSVAQLTSDATVIGELANQNASAVHVIVSDTASDISAAFNALSGNSLVNKIVVSDSATNEVTITAAQAASDTTALGELFLANGTTHAHAEVLDTAASITSALNALNGNTIIDKIVVSDSGTNEVTVSVGQLTSDASALGELRNVDGTTQAHVAVSDTAANISTAFNGLNINSQVNKIVVSDSGSNEVTISVSQAQTDTIALGELFKAGGTIHANVAVSDTAANISGALDFLNGDAQVDHIVISDNGAINLNATQALGDSTAIGELSNANHSAISLIVTDTAATISADLDGLNAEANISSIVISDNASLTLNATQITADASALGKISNQNASGVTINVVDTAANISANLDALQANNDIVSITVSDSAPITVTVAQITSDAVVLSELVNQDSSPVLLTVRDSATNIRLNLASLNQNSDVTSIVISNNLPLRLTVAQITTDAHALSIMHNANGSPYQLQISDNAAHISTALDSLNANTHVVSITVTDSSAIVLSISQITNDATALGELANANATPYTLSVHDTAANVSGNFNALNGNSHVVQIVVTDSATHEVSISAVQFAVDTAALAELFQADGTTQAHVNVSDTAANVTTALDALGASSQVDKITVTDSASHEVLVTIAQITSDAGALSKLFNADGTTHANVAVSDTATHVTAALDTLNANTQVNKIIVSDSATHEVVVSIAQITSDAAALAELFNADGTTHANVTVSDTAANVTTALDSLSGNSQVNKIIVSDSASHEVVVSVAQLTSDATALGELFNTDGTTKASVTVTDTAAHVSSAFDALQADAQVNKIIVSDSVTNEVTLLAAQITSDAAALAELYQADGLTLAHVKISDTAAHISGAFDALNGSSRVDKIVVTDSGSNEVTVTAAQAHNDTTALGELFNADGTTPAHVAVSDTAANISTALGQLNTNTHVDHIIISDGNPLTLSTSQVVNDTVALGEIVGPYTIVVNDTGAHISANLDALEANASVTQVIVSDNHDIVVSIAQLTSDANVLSVTMDANGLSPASLKILDTAANIQANLGNLEIDTQNHNIHIITISDNGAITLSASQLTVDSAALLDLRNANGTSVALTMSDTGAHIQAVLDQIEAYNTTSATSKITSIMVTNNAQMTVTAAQVQNDASVLAEVQNRNGSPVTFKVVDTAANITTYLNALQANGHLSTIVVSDSAAINVTLAQLTNDATAISLLHNQNATAYSLTLTDTAAHIQGAIATLNANSHVDKIVVSDSATHEVSFTVAQLNHDTAVLGELYNADGTTHANVQLVDTAGHIQALTATQFQALAGEGVNVIDSSNNKLLLAVAQYEGLGTVALTQADNVTLSDTGAAIGAMSAVELGALHTNGVDQIVVTDHALTLSLAQFNALSVSTDFATTVTINGTAGNDAITVGNNNYHLVGGAGADTMTIGTGHDAFVFNATSDSTGPTYDTVVGFDSMRDQFVLGTTVTGVDTLVSGGALDTGANFNTELAADIGAGQLGANHAVLFTATSGNLSGHTFLIVDTNGVAGYQAGQDLVIDVTGGHHFGSLSTSDFITGFT